MKMEKSLVNAIAYAKRNADKEAYSFGELLLDAQYAYHLREDEMVILEEKLTEYCEKNYLYGMH